MHAAQSRRSDYSQASWRWGNIFTAQYIFLLLYFSHSSTVSWGISEGTRVSPRLRQSTTPGHKLWWHLTGAHTQKDNFVFLFRTHHENICRAPDTLFRWCRNAQQNHFDLDKRGCVKCVESFQRTLNIKRICCWGLSTILRPKHFRTYWTF